MTASAVTVAGGSTYASTILGDRPVAYFRFDEGAGAPAADSSGAFRVGNYAGTVGFGNPGAPVTDSDPSATFAPGWMNAIAIGQTGPSGPSPAFPSGNAARTVEAWVKTTACCGNQTIASYGSTSGSREFAVMLTNANQVKVQLWSNDHWFTIGYGLDNAWHHVVV